MQHPLTDTSNYRSEHLHLCSINFDDFFKNLPLASPSSLWKRDTESMEWCFTLFRIIISLTCEQDVEMLTLNHDPHYTSNYVVRPEDIAVCRAEMLMRVCLGLVWGFSSAFIRFFCYDGKIDLDKLSLIDIELPFSLRHFPSLT